MLASIEHLLQEPQLTIGVTNVMNLDMIITLSSIMTGMSCCGELAQVISETRNHQKLSRHVNSMEHMLGIMFALCQGSSVVTTFR